MRLNPLLAGNVVDSGVDICIHSILFIFRFIQYNNSTSLEKSYKYELLAEYDLGITIDLINPEAYAKEKNAHLDPADERLLEEDTQYAPQDARRYFLSF